MTVSELRFASPGLKFYGQGVTVSAFGVALAAWGTAIVVFDPWNWAGLLFLLGGVYAIVVGAVLALLVWLLLGYGMITAWRDWRQFRPPAVVIDASGVRYLAARRPVCVPWPDIEQVGLRRTVFRSRVVAKVFLRLVPGAALLREGTVSVPAARTLNVGLLSQVAVPEDSAVRFLRETAGDRLEITEVDRRPAPRDPVR